MFLKWYYGCYPLFAYCCLSQEFYYLSRWALKYDDPDVFGYCALSTLSTRLFLPGCIMKQVVNVAQWWNAASGLAVLDKEKAAKAK